MFHFFSAAAGIAMKVAIVCGTVYGSAEEVARHASALLRAAGHETLVNPRLALPDVLAFEPQAILAVTSTTGMGELPDNLMPLYSELRDLLPGQLRGLPGGVIALGDASYGDTFCAGGEQMRELFAELCVNEVQDMLRLDGSESVTPETDAEPWLAAFIKHLG
ncbi:putative Flavodoxin [Pseudomonas ficuserectae]|uniref:Putative Flavodoxin n=2 Tax=Pseudomonas syringae group TaxID=136849 RepID=A0A0P9ZTA4_PSEA0|nr:putative Flavodoxin [Pseudomonas ficuserectae]KPX94588.1 putative Flavodoxin [Pseudomonas amygdali pv. mori]RMQ36873.1 putative Flavodoxin [Pseudomonas amygdali pv. mori]RMR38626.1 putative Flavodoxin [Pseudomonas amygdali pv. mori]RMS31317.1 putative Flavodoxin [Pseudomonas ficuserectae]